METHATPGDQALTSKLHTHCRYRHRHGRRHRSLDSTLARHPCPGTAPGDGAWSRGRLRERRGSRSGDGAQWVPMCLMSPQGKGTGMMDVVML